MRRRLLQTHWVAAGALVGACYSGAAREEGGAGEQGDTGTTATSGGVMDEGDTPTGGDTGETGEPPKVAQVPGPTIRRLTGAEFKYSVQEVLGQVTLTTTRPRAT